MSDETQMDARQFVETLESLKNTLEAMNRRLDSLEKRLKPIEKEAEKMRLQKRGWEKP